MALLALGGAVGGTFAKLPNPGRAGAASTGSPRAPAVLAAEGGRGSPRTAVKGFQGSALQNNVAGMCSDEIPNEQGGCNSEAPVQQNGYVAVGDAVIEGKQALVPVSGTICKYDECSAIRGNGISSGVPFQAAYLKATNLANGVPDLSAREEVDGKWQIDVPSLPGC